MYWMRTWHGAAMLVVYIILIARGVFAIEDFGECPPNHFKCHDKECIVSSKHCDGVADCTDGSDEDEMDCQLIRCQSPYFFKCHDDERCIDSRLLCNKEKDCVDGSDETNCHYIDELAAEKPECKDDEWQCQDYNCIVKNWVCDGSDDCVDRSDEDPAMCLTYQCKADEFQCRHNKKCIPKSWYCDNFHDCDDGSDEDNCPSIVVPMENCTLENKMFACKNQLSCVNLYKLCNDEEDCIDGSDEGGQCSNLEQCHSSTSNCTHDCHRSPGGPLCTCLNGFRKVGNNCIDINECEEYGICDQKCKNIMGSYYCSCDKGYELQSDTHTCKANSKGEAVMMFSTMTEIRALFLTSTVYYIVARQLSQVIGVEYDGRHVYWSNIFEGQESIVQSEESGTNMKPIITAGLGLPEGLAVDWVTQNIYFTDSKYQLIGVCSNTGKSCTVIHNRDIEKPRGIALLPKESYMYWSDWGTRPVIARSGMDGSEVTDLVNTDLKWPNGITIDHSNGRLYWVDAKLSRIESVKLDGTDRRRVLEKTVEHPYSIAVFEDMLYWSDWESRKIEAANKFTGKNRKTILHEGQRVYGLSIYHPSLQDTEFTNPCLDAPCSDLCLLAPVNTTKLRYTCSCPEGKILTENKHTCLVTDKEQLLLIASKQKLYKFEHKLLGRQTFKEIPLENVVIGEIGAIEYNSLAGSVILSDVVKRKIISINLDTLRSTDLVVTHVGRVNGLSFDYLGNNLFWTDAELGKLEMMSLHNHQRKTILRRLGGDIPTDVVVVPKEGAVYVSLFSPRGSHIDRITMIGDVRRSHAFEENLEGPHLPLFFDRQLHRIFWADSGTYLIEHSTADGTERHTFRQLLTPPVSVTSVGSDLFWTTSDSHLLNYANMFVGDSPNKQFELDRSFTSSNILLSSITGKDSNNHPCLINNGNCSHICLAVSDQGMQCTCPDGMFSQDTFMCALIPSCNIYYEFECKESSTSTTKHCIPIRQTCDNHKDCPNGEDEDVNYCGGKVSIQCPRGQFSCLDGKRCVDENKKCNLVHDCEDGSDESDCMKDTFEDECDIDGDKFMCNTSKECIESIRRCDYRKDCPDGSDEENCEKMTCDPLTHFRCTTGPCIPKTWECDYEIDCQDGSDEHHNCTFGKTCSSDQMTCLNGQCIDLLLKCNREEDCDDSSDEIDCPDDTRMIRFKIHPRARVPKPCDYYTEFACDIPFGRCIPKTAKCNGTKECDSGEDERNCGDCPESYFKCNNGKCIPRAWLCDKKNDCSDNSDEDLTVCQRSGSTIGKSSVEFPGNGEKLECAGYTCANGVECIKWEKVCDGNSTCKDGSDEGGLCGKRCQESYCKDECQETPTGPICRCRKGFTIMEDGKSCTDINECQTQEYCSQFCINTEGKFTCSCKYPEYSLREDRMSCKAKGPEMRFVYALYNQIRMMWGAQAHIGIVYSDINFETRINGLGIDTRRKHVFWTSETNDALFRVSLENRQIVENVTLNNPSKLAVDWITGNVYVIERGYQITTCNFEAKVCVFTYKTDPVMIIEALAIDPITRTMFWSERINQKLQFSSIYRADLTGSRAMKIISSDLTKVADIFIDAIHGKIYWADSHSRKIERATFNGTQRQELFISPDTPVDLTIFEDSIYFLVKSDSISAQRDMEEIGNVWRCGLYGSLFEQCSHVRIHPKHFTTPYHFEIMQEALQIKGPNECTRIQDDCENAGGLCVLGKFGLIASAVCICPDGTKWKRKLGPCPLSEFSRKFGNGITQIEDEFGWIWILVSLLLLLLVVVLFAKAYYMGKLGAWTGRRSFTQTNRGGGIGSWIPNMCRQPFSSHTVHFNTRSAPAGASSSDDTSAYSDFQFHHCRLSPGEHQYENPIASMQEKTVIIKGVNEINIKVGSAKDGHTQPHNMKAVDDNASDTSSTIEMASITGDNHKEPLIR